MRNRPTHAADLARGAYRGSRRRRLALHPRRMPDTQFVAHLGDLMDQPQDRESWGFDDMTRARHRVAAGADAVTFSDDKHPLYSDRGSLRWKDPKFKHSTAWFETATGADINSQAFKDGYTVEAFLKLDEDWNAATTSGPTP